MKIPKTSNEGNSGGIGEDDNNVNRILPLKKK